MTTSRRFSSFASATFLAVSSFSDRAVPGEEYLFDFEPLLSTSGWPEPAFDIDAPPGVDCETAESMFAFTPESDGTYTFVCTASNTHGSSTCTLEVTAETIPPAAPAWIPLPSPFIAVQEDFDLTLTDFVSGNPAPAISLTVGGDIAEFEDDYFYFNSPTAGTYTFTFLASNTLGTASADLAVTVVADLAPFEEWLADRHLDTNTPPTTLAINERTYYQNYIADTDPTSSKFVELSFTSDADGTFEISPLSTNRSYQLLYYTNILSSPVTNVLTPTDPATMTLPLDATGFGRLRVTLP